MACGDRPEDLPRFAEYWNSLAASDAGVREIEARIRRADGIYRWFFFRCSPLCEVPVGMHEVQTAQQRIGSHFSGA